MVIKGTKWPYFSIFPSLQKQTQIRERFYLQQKNVHSGIYFFFFPASSHRGISKVPALQERYEITDKHVFRGFMGMEGIWNGPCVSSKVLEIVKKWNIMLKPLIEGGTSALLTGSNRSIWNVFADKRLEEFIQSIPGRDVDIPILSSHIRGYCRGLSALESLCWIWRLKLNAFFFSNETLMVKNIAWINDQ